MGYKSSSGLLCIFFLSCKEHIGVPHEKYILSLFFWYTFFGKKERIRPLTVFFSWVLCEIMWD